MQSLSKPTLVCRLLLFATVPLALASCASPTTPAAPTEVAPAPDVEETAPTDAEPEGLRVPVLGVSSQEPGGSLTLGVGALAEDLAVEEERQLVEGDQLQVGQEGRALVEGYIVALPQLGAADLDSVGQGEPWLTATLLAGTTLAVEELSHDPLGVSLRAAAGISRYRTGAEETDEAHLSLLLGETIGEITAQSVPVEFAVCFEPASGSSASDTPRVWVAAIDGELALTVGAGDDTGADADRGDDEPTLEPAEVPLLAGDIAAVTSLGDISISAADEGVVERWFANALAGESDCFGGELSSAARATSTAAVALTADAATPVAGPSGQLSADSYQLAYGECTTLHWTVKNAMLASLNGEGVSLTGSQKECPTKTTIYTLKWSGLTGSSGETSVTIEVIGAPTEGASAEEEEDEEEEERPSEPEATDTECIPCKRPTRRPSATMPPAQTQPPTEPIEPTVVPPTEPPATEPPATEAPTELPPTEQPTEPPATEPPPTAAPEPTDAP